MAYQGDYSDLVLDVLEDYPEVLQSVDIYRESPAFEETYRPKEVNVYFDECWVAGWTEQGRVDIIPNLIMPPTAHPEVIEIEVDGSPGLLLVLGTVVLNRIEKIPGRELWMVDLERIAATTA